MLKKIVFIATLSFSLFVTIPQAPLFAVEIDESSQIADDAKIDNQASELLLQDVIEVISNNSTLNLSQDKKSTAYLAKAIIGLTIGFGLGLCLGAVIESVAGLG